MYYWIVAYKNGNVGIFPTNGGKPKLNIGEYLFNPRPFISLKLAQDIVKYVQKNYGRIK